MAASNQLGTRVPPATLAELEARGEKSTIARRDLERYYVLMADGRKRLAREFSAGDLAYLAEMSAGTLWEPLTVKYLPHEIEDAAEDGLPERHGVEAAALAAKVEALPLADRFALVDAIQRFWWRVGRQERPEPGRLLMDEVTR